MQSLNRFVSIFILCLLSLTAKGNAASEGLAYADTLEIDSSVVSAWRSAGAVTPAQTLDGKILERMSSMSVSDAVRYFSGVQIKDYGGVGGLKTVNVRSLGSQLTGVFYDGVEIGNAQNGQVDLGRFSLDRLESISLYNGQKSSILQSASDYASGSSVYLNSRAPVFTDGKRHNFRASLAGGSFGTVSPTLSWEWKISPSVSSSVDLSYLYTTGKYKFRYAKADGYDTTAVRRNGDVNALRAEMDLYGSMDKGSWRVKGYFYGSERGYPGAFVRETPGFFKNEDRQWDRNFFLQGSFDRNWELYSLKAKVKYSYDWLRYLSDPRKDVSTMYVDNSYLQNGLYLSVAHGVRIFGWWYLSLASDWSFNTLDSNIKDFAFPRRSRLLNALSSTWNWWFIKLQCSLLHNWTHDKTVDGKTDFNRLSPSVSLSLKPLRKEDLHIRVFYKDIFRMPTLNDLYYTAIGNRKLRPERARQYDLGLSWALNRSEGFLRSAEINFDAYANSIRDKIIAVPSGNMFQWTMTNIGKVGILGADLNFTAAAALCRAGKNELIADLRLNYTYQRARDLSDPGSEWYGGQIPYIPEHSGSAVAGLSWGSYSLLYSFIYTGERYESSANIDVNRQQPWYTSDISLSGSWRLGSSAGRQDSDAAQGRNPGCCLRVRADVNNIFNQQYEVVNCYPMPGTNFRITISFII